MLIIVLLLIVLFLFLSALALMYITSSDLTAFSLKEQWTKFDTWMQYQCSNHRRRFLLSVIGICVFVFLTLMSLVGSDPVPEPVYIAPTAAAIDTHRGPRDVKGNPGPDGIREPDVRRGPNGIDGSHIGRPQTYYTTRTNKYASSAYQLICIDNVEYVVSAEHRSNAVTAHIDSTTGKPINCTE